MYPLIVVGVDGQGQRLVLHGFLNHISIGPPKLFFVYEVVQDAGSALSVKDGTARGVADQPVAQHCDVLGDVFGFYVLQQKDGAVHVTHVCQGVVQVVTLRQGKGVRVQAGKILNLHNIPIQQWQNLAAVNTNNAPISQDQHVTFSSGEGIYEVRVVVDLATHLADSGGVYEAEGLFGDGLDFRADVVNSVLEHALELRVAVLLVELLTALLEILPEKFVEHWDLNGYW
jgi:hypothetical protein